MVKVEDTDVNLILYDTAGQERFQALTVSYYRQGEVALLCFDMSELSTFDNANWWLNKVQEYNPTCKFVLVGCKEDLAADDFDASAIQQWAEEKGIQYFTTSAKKGG